MKAFFRKVRGVLLHEKIICIICVVYRWIVGNQVSRGLGLATARAVGDLGPNVRFFGASTIHDGWGLSIEGDVRVGSGCFFFCKGRISIGRGTIISRNVTIYSGNHNYKSAFAPYDDTYLLDAVDIGRSVWIGMNVSILPGVRIGDGAIIGMGAVVARDVAPGEIVVSQPQRVIGSRDMRELRLAIDEGRLFTRHWPDA